MPISKDYIVKLKRIFQKAYDRSLNYAQRKEKIIASLRQEQDSINRKLRGCELGETIEALIASISRNKFLRSYRLFSGNVNKFIQQGEEDGLTDEEINLIWIIRSGKHSKEHHGTLSKLEELLQNEVTFLEKAARMISRMISHFIRNGGMRQVGFTLYMRRIRGPLVDFRELVSGELSEVENRNVDGLFEVYGEEIKKKQEVVKQFRSNRNVVVEMARRSAVVGLGAAAACSVLFLIGCSINTNSTTLPAAPEIGATTPPLDVGNKNIPKRSPLFTKSMKYDSKVHGYGSRLGFIDFGKSGMVNRDIPLYTYGMAGCSAIVIDAYNRGAHYMFHVQYPQNRKDIERDIKKHFPEGLDKTIIYVRPGVFQSDWTVKEIMEAFRKLGINEDRIHFIPNDEKDSAPPELIIYRSQIFDKFRFLS